MLESIKLETYIRTLIQPPPSGYIPLTDLKTRSFSPVDKLVCTTDFSRMLLSSIVQNIVAYCISEKEARAGIMLEPLVCRVSDRILEIDDVIEQEREKARVSKWVDNIKTAEKITGSFIEDLARLLTYAPVSKGGYRKYPDGGAVIPTYDDRKLIWTLARRSYSFLYEDHPEDIEYKVLYDVNTKNFSTATIDFLTDQAAYKISPLTTAPQPRDVLLVYIWAVLAGVDRFGIFNPNWNLLYWSNVSSIDKSIQKAIKNEVLKV